MNAKRIWILLLTAVGGGAGFVLRRWQLLRAGGGLLSAADPVTWYLVALCAVLVLALAVVSARLPQRSAYVESFSSGAGVLVLSLAAAAAVLAGVALDLLGGAVGGIALVIRFLGVVAALCIAVTAVLRFRGIVPHFALHALPCVYLVAKLILEFKQWSVDPAVLDYCFDLFFAISAMCATYHLGGFCFDKGGRRMSVFWCLGCVVFAAVSLADGGLSRCLLLGGLGLWAAVNGWQLLEEPAAPAAFD